MHNPSRSPIVLGFTESPLLKDIGSKRAAELQTVIHDPVALARTLSNYALSDYSSGRIKGNLEAMRRFNSSYANLQTQVKALLTRFEGTLERIKEVS